MGRCKDCKKNGGIGGSAITPYFCIECGEGHFWSNTNHPLLCPKCMEKAQSEGRCVR